MKKITVFVFVEIANAGRLDNRKRLAPLLVVVHFAFLHLLWGERNEVVPVKVTVQR